MTRIAVIGDVHSFWDDIDLLFFNARHENSAANTDMVVFVGDLPDRLHRKSHKIAKCMAQLSIPGYFFPGNHDGVTIPQLIAEIFQSQFWSQLFARRQKIRVSKLRKELHPLQFCQYNIIDLNLGGRPVSMVCGRPHSMGGDSISMRPYLSKNFQVATIQDSIGQFKRLLEQCGNDDLIFLSHNGPSGLGSESTDIWGNDFQKGAGDFGDPDLAAALAIAREMGKNPRAVIAGHMHHHVRKKSSVAGQRKKVVVNQGCMYINAARVPRIFYDADEKINWHYFMALDLTDKNISVQENLFALDSSGQWRMQSQDLAQIKW